MTIINGTERDAVVKMVVEGEAQRAYCSVYVRTGDQWTVEGIAAGRYRILFALGDGWDASRQSFAETISVQQFEQPMTFEDTRTVTQTTEGTLTDYRSTRATITLNKVMDGTARTTACKESDFDALQ